MEVLQSWNRSACARRKRRERIRLLRRHPGDDLDYMHARFGSPVAAKFLSVDRIKRNPKLRQSCNRYAYPRNNPIKFVDPDGTKVPQATDPEQRQRQVLFSSLAADPGLGPTPLAMAGGKVGSGVVVKWFAKSRVGRAIRDAATRARAAVQAFRILRSFSPAQRGVVKEAASILRSSEFQKLRTAFEAGTSAEVKIGERTILVEPDLPLSDHGFTLSQENGFAIGPGAFESEEELAKTIIHELPRLTFSEGASGVSQALATAETDAAFNFAETACRVLWLYS